MQLIVTSKKQLSLHPYHNLNSDNLRRQKTESVIDIPAETYDFM